jgi:hypothetical protein
VAVDNRQSVSRHSEIANPFDNRQSGNRHSEIGNPLIFNRQSAIANRQGFDALN